jgi:hypothetical protein
MRQRARRYLARAWIRSGARVTIKTYAKRYGVDRATTYDDLTALGVAVPVPAPARQPKLRPAKRGSLQSTDPGGEMWTMVDGRLFFVVDWTADGAPYGLFADDCGD